MREMNKYLSTLISLAVVGLVVICAYLFVQLDEVISEIKSLTDTVTSQKGIIYETESDLGITKKGLVETEAELINYLKEPGALEINEKLEDMYSLTVNRLGTAITDGFREELQPYSDTGITVNSEVVPPYRANLRPRFNLENNPDATNVSWSELKNFLLE